MNMASRFTSLDVRSIHPLNAAILSVSVWALFKLIKATWGRKVRTIKLKGPPSQSFVLGVGGVLDAAEDAGAVYEHWAEEYGHAYQVAAAFGKSRLVLVDPKAIAHYLSRDTTTYIASSVTKLLIENLIGRGLLWSQGDSHKRQRKGLTPAFSNVVIRRLTSVFFDSAYKAKAAWECFLESNPDGALIEVQSWLSNISLDSIGIAGFSHDFGTLEGKRPVVLNVLEEISSAKPSILVPIIIQLAAVFPWLVKLPTSRRRLIAKLNRAMGEISEELLTRTRQEMKGGMDEEKSVIGLLIKSENEDTDLRLTADEIMAQMKLLLLAGYETTSISLTWALIELSYHQDKQEKLREELRQFANSDPTWDHLTNELPYLDAVVHEILRLHPPVPEVTRVAAEDDVIPLSATMQTAAGEMVDQLTIAKGTFITIPFRCINRSTDFWGPDAKEFMPERWLGEGVGAGKAKDIQGHRHLLTFSDGPRICLGKGFALTEIKAVMCVLIKNFTFELRDRPDDTKIVSARGVLPRPALAGEVGCRVPLRVRRAEL